ncbi:hypothetical protein N7478_004478 [Penicillium angulare]|uniref:uncharacterized protein n=1 Tax=Penicillium angulare TaxID=116970 RepID=UPI0025412C05|nr:uncharacterized protein N7478_004478 [Penicillium angulare]KAJ5279106.1 hypothetical protein N7478_004478 [Penicillium angulare]
MSNEPEPKPKFEPELELNEHEPPQVQDPSWLYRTINALKGCNWTTLNETHVPPVNLQGNWIIITGANNGIGFEAAKTFATWGANLILGCREPPEWETHPTIAVEEILSAARAAGHENVVEWWAIDMGDLDSVNAFAKRWVETGRALDVLCNNAGMAPHSANEQAATKDGIQILHQVNTISHIFLTYILLDSLSLSPAPRIVCTTSCHQFRGFFTPSTMNDCTIRPVHLRGDIYANNKLYFQMWVAEMNRRLLSSPKYKHITINGFNPGFINSGLWKFSPENRATAMGKRMEWTLNFFVSRFGISSYQGSLGIVYVATSGEFGGSWVREGGELC